MKTLLINAGKCIDCRNCQTACKDEHCDNDWSPIAALQGPKQYWIKVQNAEAGDGERVRMERVPLTCQQCADAPCLRVAEDGAAYRRADGIIIFDTEKAKGQRAIMDACPYGAVYWNEALDVPQKCTMCAHLFDAGRQPRCVTACPTDALKFVDTADYEDETLLPQPLERLHPEYGTRPLVLFQDLPKPFIAGETCTADGKACLEGVYVTATHQITGFAASAETDAFGEFMIKGLEPGYYTVRFEGDGMSTKEISNLDVCNSVNMGAVKIFARA